MWFLGYLRYQINRIALYRITTKKRCTNILPKCIPASSLPSLSAFLRSKQVAEDQMTIHRNGDKCPNCFWCEFELEQRYPYHSHLKIETGELHTCVYTVQHIIPMQSYEEEHCVCFTVPLRANRWQTTYIISESSDCERWIYNSTSHKYVTQVATKARVMIWFNKMFLSYLSQCTLQIQYERHDLTGNCVMELWIYKKNTNS